MRKLYMIFSYEEGGDNDLFIEAFYNKKSAEDFSKRIPSSYIIEYIIRNKREVRNERNKI